MVRYREQGWRRKVHTPGTRIEDGHQPTPAARLRRALLRVPLFAKILIANAVVVVLVAISGALLAIGLAGPESLRTAAELIAVIAAGGVAVSIIVNAVILRLALLPLKKIEQTAWRVQAGDLDARVEPSILADRNVERIMLTFNAMLDSAVAHRQRLREVAARALTAAEEERKRVARELHDGTAQTLAGLRMRLRLARATEDADVRSAQLEQVSREIGEAIEEVRRMSKGLRPPTLDVLGLAPAIDAYARSVTEAAGLELDLRTELVAGVLTTEAELALYRILQEALSNVVRHAGASVVRIRLERNGADVQLAIEDDGSGFDVGAELGDRTRGLGLFGMQERAAYVGGRVSITSTPGRGTGVLVTLPSAEAMQYA
jgi:two-component system, NarL family, sensor histidine kinase UhpB